VIAASHTCSMQPRSRQRRKRVGELRQRGVQAVAEHGCAVFGRNH
jgi:hypothetical protein